MLDDTGQNAHYSAPPTTMAELARGDPFWYRSKMAHDEEPVILGFGGVAADLLCEVTALPWSDGVTYIRSSKRETGGMIGTALVAIARLGGRAAYAGLIGDDPEGAQVHATFEREGVDAARAAGGAAGSTPFSVVLVEAGGKRAIVHHRGARNLDTLPGALPSLDGIAHLHLDCTWLGTALPLARAARDRGIGVSLDVSQNQRDPRVRELLDSVTHAVVNAPFARAYTGRDRLPDAARVLREWGARTVVITNGADRGYCLPANDTGFPFVPCSSANVVDTTGAGDAFHGAYVYAVTHAYPARDAVCFAAAAAAINCRTLGGQSGLPAREEVERALCLCDAGDGAG